MAKSILRVPLRFSSTLSHLRILNVVVVVVIARFILPSAVAATSTPVKRTNERTKRMRAFMLSRSGATSNYRYVYEMNGRRAAVNIIIMPTTSLRDTLSLCLPLSVSLSLAPIRDSSGKGRNMSVHYVCVCVRTINAIVLGALYE